VTDLDPAPAALTEPCPCDACKHAVRCKAQLLACDAYGMYVASESERRWRLAPRAPTSARYQALLEGKPGRPGRRKRVELPEAA
jgi:hypothetical protein